MLIHALIASRVDYRNSVLFHNAAVHLRPLHSVINAAARLVVKKRKSDSVTATLRDTLHWLLVRERIDFKLSLLVYKCLRQLAAPYLESMIFPVSAVLTRRHLRSAGQGDLTVQRTRTVGFGPRSRSVAGPSLWNTLPSDMKQSSLSIVQFCSQLKSCLSAASTHERSRHNPGLLDLREVKKVKTSIYIARFMHQAPLTRTPLKLGRQTAI